MKIGKNSPKIGFSPDFLFLGYFFPIFIPGPISGPIWFPISGRRPETYFLAGRLDRNSRLSRISRKMVGFSFIFHSLGFCPNASCAVFFPILPRILRVRQRGKSKFWEAPCLFSKNGLEGQGVKTVFFFPTSRSQKKNDSYLFYCC